MIPWSGGLPSAAIGGLERRAVGEPRQGRVGGVGQSRTGWGWTSAGNSESGAPGASAPPNFTLTEVHVPTYVRK